jgi:cell division protein FtsB
MKAKKILKVVFNKYLIALVAMGVWLTFFDRNDVFTQLDLYRKVQKLQKEKNYYTLDINANKKMIYDLQNDADVLEKFVRVNHLMKKADEDVFILSAK